MKDNAAFTLYLAQCGYAESTGVSIVRNKVKFELWLNRHWEISMKLVSYQIIIQYIGYVKKQGCSQRTIWAYIRHVWLYFNWLAKKRQIHKNPADGIRVRHRDTLILYDRFSSAELLSMYESYKSGLPGETSYLGNQNWMMAERRGIILLGFMVFQGLKNGEMHSLLLGDLDFEKHRIFIRKGCMHEARYLDLHSSQEKDIREYLGNARTNCRDWETRTQLILTITPSGLFNNLVKVLLRRLRKTHPQILCTDHLRSSVIANWVQQDSLRLAQYNAGHRQVTSTQKYKAYHLEEIQQDISRFHPL